MSHRMIMLAILATAGVVRACYADPAPAQTGNHETPSLVAESAS